jgi:hypothetical protein
MTIVHVSKCGDAGAPMARFTDGTAVEARRAIGPLLLDRGAEDPRREKDPTDFINGTEGDRRTAFSGATARTASASAVDSRRGLSGDFSIKSISVGVCEIFRAMPMMGET